MPSEFELLEDFPHGQGWGWLSKKARGFMFLRFRSSNSNDWREWKFSLSSYPDLRYGMTLQWFRNHLTKQMASQALEFSRVMEKL